MNPQLSHPPLPPWVALDAALDAAIHGQKAARLAAARAADLPVVDGWVLPVAGPSRVSRTLIAPLVEAAPARGWMLRSSSPLEDRPAASAAGLLHSEGCEATPEALEQSLRAVLESATRVEALRLLAADRIPLAVLAQPRLVFPHWATVEASSSGQVLLAEGWGPGAIALRSVEDLENSPEGRALLELAGAAAIHFGENALLELGHDGTQAWLLQLRPAPRGGRPESVPSIAMATAPSSGGAPHLGDEAHEWIHDREHSPTPLCPLLAGIFARGLAPDYPSRLIDGRWHDRAATGPSLDFASAEQTLDRWKKVGEATLRESVLALETRAAHLEAGDWPGFVEAWLAWQTQYFELRPAGLRSWARRMLSGSAFPLPPTLGSQRLRAWRGLADEIEELDPAVPRSAEALGTWVAEHPDHPLGLRLREALGENAHLAAMPYDGRGRTWAEDPTPFWRALTSMRLHEATERSGDPGTLDSRARLALHAIASGEDDNDLLLRAYAAFRGAVRGLGADLVPQRNWEDLLDLLPEDFQSVVHSPATNREAIFVAALLRGRALRSQWEASAAGSGTSLQGTPAATGRATGPVWRGDSLQSIPPTSDPWVAVVCTVTPADAFVFPSLAALVCEGGDVLGHASVLAREHGVPCVVGLEGARQRLAKASKVLVDADAGRVEILSD